MDSRPALRALGEVLRELRTQRGLSQEEAADLLNLSQTVVSNRELGVSRVQIEDVLRFEDALGLQRGEVYRRAGYVVDAHTPPEQIDTWSSFLTAKDLGLLHYVVDPAWEEAQRGPGGRG